MNGQRLSVFITAVAGGLGTFLPWMTISMGPMSRTESGIGAGASDAWIILFLFSIAAFGSLVGDRTQPVKGGTRITVIVLVVIGALIAIVDMDNFNSAMGGGFRLMAVESSIGFGLYLIVIAGFLLPILAFAVKGGGDYATRFPGRAGSSSGKREI